MAVAPVLPQPMPRATHCRTASVEARSGLPIWELHKAGWLQQLLVRGIGRTTVFRYLRTSTFPERQGRRDCGRSRLLDPYKDMFFNVGTMVVMTPCGCLGDQSVVILAAMTQSLAMPSLSSSPRNATEETTAFNSTAKVSEPQNCLLHRVAQHLVLQRPEKWEPVTHSSAKPWHSILTSPKRLNLPFSLPSLFASVSLTTRPWLEQAQRASFLLSTFCQTLARRL